MEEKRSSDRRRTYLAARIAFNERSSTMDSVVRNLSRNGAMLEFSEPVTLCHQFDLRLLSRADDFRARVVWCDRVRAGVAIQQSESGSVITIEEARLVKKLNADRKALAERIARSNEPL